MGRDHRLDLGRYVSNPFDKRGKQLKKLNFNDLFSSKPEGGEYPWNLKVWFKRLIASNENAQSYLEP